tara:strand:- start:1383 stop:1577 length:195 start_codon:yes stop_codon:yes gene_type:complete
MSDCGLYVGDLVTDRLFRPERVGIIIAVDFVGNIASLFFVCWIGFPGVVSYRDWEIKKYKPDKK